MIYYVKMFEGNAFIMLIIAEWIPKPWGIILIIISFLIPSIKIAIDSYKMNSIERIRLTNVGQVIIFGSQVIAVSIILGCLIFMFMLNDKEFLKENTNIPIIISSSFIVSFLLVLISFIIVYSVVKIFSVKTQFYIFFNDEKLTIVRKIGGKIYLLKGEKNKSLFLEADKLLNKKIYEELKFQPRKKGFMFWLNKHSILLFIASLLTLLQGIVLTEYFAMIVVGGILFTLGTVFLLLIAVGFKNQEDITRLNPEE